MSATGPSQVDRREWLARWARPAALLGMVLLVVRLLRGERWQLCQRSAPHCGGCQLLARCTTRRAAAARDVR
jgi:hypothetical protein